MPVDGARIDSLRRSASVIRREALSEAAVTVFPLTHAMPPVAGVG
jgi:hypothetical protein